ncbi:PilZ domain-containing protein [Nocardioides sp. GY 10113]|uniref:PilZ domain-containing protein n=1 Tax=Nocardioides sp. GY 10113 TaxID=2569761 RepID=UPI0010A75410|nr:PilZ domain-containing protein [Nocardioides sp. GY 10113]TIC84798.1 PilZ domain-containing protein [Nocardioides sp. GY 10113]
MRSTSRGAIGQTEAPELLQAVTVVVRREDGTTEELGSQVQDLEDGAGGRWTATLARPERADGLPVTRPGAAAWVALEWVTATGIARVPVDAAAAQRPYGPVWVATAIGPVERHQRRSYFRVPLSAELTLTRRPTAEDAAEEGEAEPVEPVVQRGWVVDLGEGGALVGLRDEVPGVDEEVEVAIDLDAGEVRRPARVIRRVDFPGGTSGAALEFPGPDPSDRVLRAALLEAQRRQARGRRR